MTVSRWRKQLGISTTPGDRQLALEVRRSRKASPAMRAALLAAARRTKSEEHRRKIAATHKGKPKAGLSRELRIRIYFLARNGVSSKEVAERLGLHRRTVAKYRGDTLYHRQASQLRQVLRAWGRDDLSEMLDLAGVARGKRKQALRWMDLVQAGKGIYVAADAVGVARPTVWRWTQALLALR